MVEMAVVMPLLIILVFGLIVFGLAINTKLAIVNAAREGARLAATGAASSEVIERVDQSIRSAGLSTALNRYVKETDIEIASTSADVKVTVTYRQPSMIPLIGNLVGSDKMTLTASVVFRKEE